MNDLKVFMHQEFGDIRTTVQDGEPWFIAKDIATALGYANTRKAISDHVDEEDRDGVTIRDSMGRVQEAIAINESGMYSLIMCSKLESAKRFKHWVTSDVLPAIRKTGGYSSEKLLTGPELMAAALLEADKTIKSHELRIAEMRPKEIFADAVCASPSTILVGELAKVMSQNGFKIGANRLFERLRQDGFLIRGNRSDRNLPTQKSMEMGLFEIKETAITHSDGHVTTNKTPKVTGKGQVYFVNRYCRMELSA